MTPSFVDWVLDRLAVLVPQRTDGDPASKAPVPLQAQDSTKKPELTPDSGNFR